MDLSLASRIQTPQGPQPAVAQFNKLTGALCAVLFNVDPDTLDQTFFDYRVVDEFDFATQQIVGTIDDFKVVEIQAMPGVIYESDLDMSAQQKITKVYPVINQLNNIGRVLDQLAEKVGLDTPEVSKMREMFAYIEEIKADNDRYKEFYKASEDYEYKDYASVAQDDANRMEGGVHEAYGPRTVASGRVF